MQWLTNPLQEVHSIMHRCLQGLPQGQAPPVSWGERQALEQLLDQPHALQQLPVLQVS